MPSENWIATGILHVCCLEPRSGHSSTYLPNLNQEHRTLTKTERNVPSLSSMFGGRIRSKGHYNAPFAMTNITGTGARGMRVSPGHLGQDNPVGLQGTSSCVSPHQRGTVSSLVPLARIPSLTYPSLRPFLAKGVAPTVGLAFPGRVTSLRLKRPGTAGSAGHCPLVWTGPGIAPRVPLLLSRMETGPVLCTMRF